MTTTTKWTDTIYSLLAERIKYAHPSDFKDYIEELEHHLEDDINNQAKALTAYFYKCSELVTELETDYSSEEIESFGNYTIGEWRVLIENFAYQLVQAALNDALYTVKEELLEKFEQLEETATKLAPNKELTYQCLSENLDLELLGPLTLSHDEVSFNENKSKFLIRLNPVHQLWVLAA